MDIRLSKALDDAAKLASFDRLLNCAIRMRAALEVAPTPPNYLDYPAWYNRIRVEALKEEVS